MALIYPDLDTPALIVDLDKMESNLDDMAALARSAGMNLRPHTKTHKSPIIARMQTDRGAVGITVAKLGEAEVMAEAGLNDILIAYPLIGPLKLNRLAALAKQIKIKVSLDSLEAAMGIAEVGRAINRDIPVLIELNTGLNRLGVSPGQDLVALALEMSSIEGIRIIGLLAHAGHSASATSAEAIEEVARTEGHVMLSSAEDLRRIGVQVDEISVGSTPASKASASIKGITEMRPGTYVFNDVNTVGRWAADWTSCAASILCTVISRPAPNRAVIDAGSKSLGTDQSRHSDCPGYGYVVGYADVRVERVYEEHGVLSLGDSSSNLAIGDRLEIIPNHICTCVNLSDVMYGVRGSEVIMEIPVAGRGKRV